MWYISHHTHLCTHICTQSDNYNFHCYSHLIEIFCRFVFDVSEAPPLPWKVLRTSLFWNQLWMTLACEQWLRILHIPCSRVLTVSWSFYSKRQTRKSKHIQRCRCVMNREASVAGPAFCLMTFSAVEPCAIAAAHSVTCYLPVTPRRVWNQDAASGKLSAHIFFSE